MLTSDEKPEGDENPPIVVRGTEILPTDSRPAARPCVLVVEDNPDMNRFICGALAGDHDVIAAFDGAEGLAKALAARPALIVTDLVMPGVSGAEMIRELRARPALSHTPVLLLSPTADDGSMVELLDDGAQDFIVKPFAEKALRVRVRNLLLAESARVDASESLAREQAARAEAEQQKRMLHSLFMQAPTLIAVLRGPDHIVEMANPPICQVWGRAQSEVTGRPLFDAVPEVREQGFPQVIDAVYASGVTQVGKETPARFRRDGGVSELLYFNFTYSPFRNADGETDGIFVIGADVTAQVVAREQVEALRQSAESANRAKDEFLAMLGHELRNPLSPIVTALQLIKLRGPEASERARVVIERQVDHLTRLVDDLLDVSRIARGKVELKTEIVEMVTVVQKAIEMASPLLEERAHTITIDVSRRGLAVDGDPTRLAQVVSNLMTNAAKYTPRGGHITITADRLGGDVVVRVRDTGIGIAADMLPHVFDLFVQERQAIDRSRGGLGIGLTIVRNLVERHGGTVSARSAGPGRGSEFIIRLPRAARGHITDEGAAIAAPAPSPTAVRAHAPRILVVDDNEDAADLLGEALSRRGYDTRVAHDAPTALQMAPEFHPDVAFLDIGLPVMDGYELAAHLRGMPQLRGLRLIAITGYGQESDFRKARQAGFHLHLVKPVAMEAIEAAIADAPPHAS